MVKEQEQATDEFGEDRAVFLPVWPFDNKPILVGTITGREQVKGIVSPLNGEIHDVDLYTVATDDGEPFNVWGSGMLSRVLPAHVSHRVRIEDKGIDTSRPVGAQVRVFDVRCATCTASKT